MTDEWDVFYTTLHDRSEIACYYSEKTITWKSGCNQVHIFAENSL